MKKWLKGILIACVVFLIAAFIGVAIFILTFDTTVYKNKLASMVKSQYNRELSVNGDIKLSLFPRIGLNASDVSLSEPGSTKEFAHVDNIRFAVAIWPLISNRFLVDHMSVSGLRANIVRDHDGLLNFDDLLSLSQTEQEPLDNLHAKSATEASTAPDVNRSSEQVVNESLGEWLAKTDFKVDVAGLVLQKAQFNYQDVGLKHKLQLDNVQIDTGRITLGQAFDIHLQADLKGEQPYAAATLDVSGLLLLNPEKQQYTAQKLRANLLGQFKQYDITKANLSGDFNLDTLSYAIFGKAVELSMQAKGLEQSSTDTVSIEMTAPQLDYNASDLSLGLENFALNSRLQRKDQQAIDLELRSPELDVSPTKAGGKPLTGKMTVQRIDQKIDLGFSLSNISGIAQDLNVEKVELSGLYQSKADNQIEIALNSAGKFNLFEQTITLPYLQGELQVQDSPESKQTFPMTGMLKTNLLEDQTDFQLSFINAQGKLAITGIFTKFFKPRISFDVSADKFRLDSFFADLALMDEVVDQPSNAANEVKSARDSNAVSSADKASEGTESQVAQQSTADGSSSSLNFKQELLARLSGVGTFNFKELSYHDVVLNNFGATLIFDQQDIQIKSLKADAFDGKLSANGEYTLATNALRTDASFVEIQADKLLQQLKSQALLSGVLDLHIDMRSYGRNEADLIKHLQGQVEMTAKTGSFNGVNVEELLHDPLLYSNQDTMPLEVLNIDLTKQTTFDQVVLQADVAEEQINFKQLDVSAPLGNLQLRKLASFYNWRDDMAQVPLVFQSNKPIAVHQGGVMFRIKSVQLPLVITGPRKGLRLNLELRN